MTAGMKSTVTLARAVPVSGTSGMIFCPDLRGDIAAMRCAQRQMETGCHCPNRVTFQRYQKLQRAMETVGEACEKHGPKIRIRTTCQRCKKKKGKSSASNCKPCAMLVAKRSA